MRLTIQYDPKFDHLKWWLYADGSMLGGRTSYRKIMKWKREVERNYRLAEEANGD